MIRFDYGNNEKIKMLKQEYLNLFSNLGELEKHWRLIRKDLVKIDKWFAILPYKYKELLIADFKDLLPIYQKYKSLDIKSKHEDVHDKSLYYLPYSRKKVGSLGWSKAYQPIIASFFMKEAYGFNLNTCPYCDMTYINAYQSRKQGRLKNHFDLDHILDRMECPILSLCLFNLVPCCPVCNERLKKSGGISDSLKLKLSPTNPDYDFEEKVSIQVVDRASKASIIDYEKRLSDFHIYFNTSLDPDYLEEVKVFELEGRYDYHKMEALRLLYLKECYGGTKLEEYVRLMIENPKAKVTPGGMRLLTKLRHDIFADEFNKRHHRAFGKLYKDMLL